MQFETRARLVTKLYYLYSAGANERSNEEMRQVRMSYFHLVILTLENKMKLLAKNCLDTLTKALHAAIAYELGEEEQDIEALEELGIAPQRFRTVAGLKVVSNSNRDEQTDKTSAERIDKLLQYRADEFLVRAKLARALIEPVAVLPLTLWEHICNRLKLYRFTPNGNTVRGENQELRSTLERHVSITATPILRAKYRTWHKRALYIFLLIDVISLGYYLPRPPLAALLITPIAGLVIWLIGCGVLSGYPNPEQRKALEQSVLQSVMESLESRGTLAELLWPDFNEPTKGSLAVTITMPTPPQYVQEKLVALEKTRLPVHIAAVQEAIASSFPLSNKIIGTKRTFDTSMPREPVIYVIQGSAVAIVELYGDFPMDQDFVKEVINSTDLI